MWKYLDDNSLEKIVCNLNSIECLQLYEAGLFNKDIRSIKSILMKRMLDDKNHLEKQIENLSDKLFCSNKQPSMNDTDYIEYEELSEQLEKIKKLTS